MMRKIVLSIFLGSIVCSSFAIGGGGPIWIRPDMPSHDYSPNEDDNSRGYDVQYNQQSRDGNTSYGDVTATNLNNGKTYTAQGSETTSNGNRSVNATVSNNQNSNTYQVSGNQNLGCNGNSCTKNTNVSVTNNQTGTTKTYNNTQQSTQVNVSNPTYVYPNNYYYPYPYYYGAPVPVVVGGVNTMPQNTSPNLITSRESQIVPTESEVIFNQ